MGIMHNMSMIDDANGSTFIELRSLASAFGVELQWDAATKTVTIVG